MAVLFYDLPTEILLAVFCDLDAKTIRKCRAISRFFLSLVDGSVVLQYHLALGSAGYIDGPQSPISTYQRLQKLLHHQTSWKSLDWQRSDKYLINDRASTYELYGGIYASGINRSDGSHLTRGMELVEFPSLLRNMNEGHTWVINDLGIDVKDFGMDPDHNLLVAMENVPARQTPTDNPPLCVHLLTLRDEEATPHPLANVPILKYQPRAWNRQYSFWVQVVGDVLAVLFMPGSHTQLAGPPVPLPCADELMIWKWKTGKLIASIRFENVALRSFSFLSNDIILAPCVLGHEEGENVRSELRLYKLPDTDESLDLSLIATYQMPPFKHGVVRGLELTCRLDPSPWAPPPRTQAQQGDQDEGKQAVLEVVWPAHGAAPFAPAPLNRIVVLSIWVIIGDPGEVEARAYTAFVKGETLLKVWTTSAEENGVVPWDTWGTEYSRFLEEPTDRSCVCYVYGMRYCRLIAGSGRPRKPRLRLMDFNDEGFDEMLSQELTVPTGPIEAPPADPVEMADIMEDDGDDEWVSDTEEEQAEDADWGVPKDAIAGFGNLRIRNQTERERCDRRKVALHPSYIRDDAIFEEPLVTGLRFRWMMKDHDALEKFQTVMIDDEHIIGIRDRPRIGGRQTVEVLTL